MRTPIIVAAVTACLISISEGASCKGSFKHPSGCTPRSDGSTSGTPCQFEAEWEGDLAENKISVKVNQAFNSEDAANWTPDRKKWMGIGWNTERQMGGGETVLLKVSKDGATQNLPAGLEVIHHSLMGKTGSDLFSPSAVTVVSKKSADNVLEMEFTRPLDNGHINLKENCVYFLYPVGGGLTSSAYTIGKHEITPLMGTEKVCFATCTEDSGESSEEHDDPGGEMVGDGCGGAYKYHPNASIDCLANGKTGSADPCSYEARWFKNNTDIHFQVVMTVPYDVNQWSPGLWTGIGFNSKKAMDQSQAVLLHMPSKNDYTARQMTAKQYKMVGYNVPTEVTEGANIGSIGEFLAENGIVSFNFTWDLTKTGFDLRANCLHMIFPAGGGRLSNQGVQIHFKNPLISVEKFCFDTCKVEGRVEDEGSGIKRDDNSAPSPIFNFWLFLLALVFYTFRYLC